MDVAAPTLDQRAGPSGRLRIRGGVDPRSVIRKALDRYPKATVDEIASTLAKWQYPVSGVWIAREMQRTPFPAGDESGRGSP